jgi:glucose/arabinose dehydrogenase
MKSKILITAIAVTAAACTQPAMQEPARVELSAAANPVVPAGTPVWKQGMSQDAVTSPLAPHPARLTVTPPGDVPVGRLKVPAGFKVELWAHGMPGARMMARGPQGKVYVGTRSIGRVYEVTDRGGTRETRVLIDKLTQPNGLVFKGNSLYVMAIDKFLRFDGVESNGAVQPVDITAAFKLPPKPHHNWKFLAAGPDGKLYVPFGAPCNICDPEPEYAQIRRYDWDGSNMEVVARGVRNSVGFDFHPRTRELWFTDNGRDWAGDAGPEDELNRVSRSGEFFGFPYCHSNGIPDQDVKKANACAGVTMPVALLGPHTAALGMRFYTGRMFPREYQESILIARHGSWNRTALTGFDVVRVTADTNGRNARVEPFLTGFIDGGKFLGRPTDVMQMPDGALLVSDEHNGAIYRISYGR